MKTQIKQLVYGILATSCFGLSCTSCTLGPKEYQWPPKEGQPIVTLLGPVYETRSETQVPLFKALEQAMTIIVENQQTHLPEFYQQRIAGMNHQLFRPGYSNEEEWGSIKNLSSKAEDYDKESMAGILESSENRKSGLEMAIRMQPTIDPQPASVTLEGYRFVLQPSGKGQAEWFTQEVKLTDREAGEEFRKALVWLLAKSFEQQKRFVLGNEEVPVWKDKNIGGLLKFAGKEFTAESEPVRNKILETCVQTGHCPVLPIKVEGDEFALVSNFVDAQTICRMFDRVVIDENTLLRLSLNKKTKTLLNEGNGSAWHSGGETGYFNERSDHLEFVQAKTTGAVWCKLAKQETSTFVPETYIWSDGRKYEGELKDDKPNGQGTLTYPDGRKYEGQWKNGKQEGQGTYNYTRGKIYEGQWKNGKRNGQGTYTYPDGGKYVGEWKDGKRNGQGTYTYPDGGKYVGEWKDGKRNGRGTYISPDGEKYVGEFKNGMPNGQGTYTYPDGSMYLGEFSDGKPNGQGTYTFPNGQKYVGEFKDGIPRGIQGWKKTWSRNIYFP